MGERMRGAQNREGFVLCGCAGIRVLILGKRGPSGGGGMFCPPLSRVLKSQWGWGWAENTGGYGVHLLQSSLSKGEVIREPQGSVLL